MEIRHKYDDKLIWEHKPKEHFLGRPFYSMPIQIGFGLSPKDPRNPNIFYITTVAIKKYETDSKDVLFHAELQKTYAVDFQPEKLSFEFCSTLIQKNIDELIHLFDIRKKNSNLLHHSLDLVSESDYKDDILKKINIWKLNEGGSLN